MISMASLHDKPHLGDNSGLTEGKAWFTLGRMKKIDKIGRYPNQQ